MKFIDNKKYKCDGCKLDIKGMFLELENKLIKCGTCRALKQFKIDLKKIKQCEHLELKWLRCVDCKKDFSDLSFGNCDHKRVAWDDDEGAYKCKDCEYLAYNYEGDE